jgi:ATP/maltotriose-dependent transcriptional regulator MalT
LIEQLEAGTRGKLTLVSALTGYGKSILVSGWVVRSKVPAAWPSLDALDNDIARFFLISLGVLLAAGWWWPGIVIAGHRDRRAS